MWNNPEGEFVRYKAKFRDRILADGSTRFLPEKDRYHLYISWACPWAHRTAIARSVLKLENVVSLSVVDPVWNERGWTFSTNKGCIPDFVNGQKDLVDIYRLADPEYDEEETTPVLWDKKLKTIVSNESADIIRMFSREFRSFSKESPDLYPVDIEKCIDETIADIYPTINNGVYRAGFATSQQAYERAYEKLFQTLDRYEEKLNQSRYLCGDQLTIADICMFTTLFRFDQVYYGHFKCNRKHVYECKALWGYLKDIYQTPGVAETCFIDHIKHHYYICQKEVNPTQIVPVGPILDYSTPHGRG